jgi:dehydrogenase/reductase SDR family protein 12
MSSIAFEQTIEIQRPLQYVYDYLVDFSNTLAWDSSVVQATRTTPGPIQVGSHFAIRVRFAWMELGLNYHITALSPPYSIELKGLADSYSIVDRIRLEGDEERCLVHYQIDVFYNEPMAKLAPVFSPLVKSNARKALDGLKRTLEGAATQWEAGLWTKLADRLVLPGMLRFTRLGYASSKTRWSGLTEDLSDKTILITGATSGIGAVAAQQLGRLGARLILVARNQRKAEQFVAQIAGDCRFKPEIEIADLSLMRDVQALCERLLSKGRAIHVLINNAGALFNQRTVTSEGLEQSFATLLLSPFVLTERLYPLLKLGAPARVINVSSGGMYTQALRLEDLESEKADYNGSQAYARAKRGLVDLTETWAENWAADGIRVHAMHPGWADTPAVSSSLPKFYETTKAWLRTPEQGADTIVWLAVAREIEAVTGLFWLDRTPHSTAIFPGTRSDRSMQRELYKKLKAYEAKFLEGAP